MRPVLSLLFAFASAVLMADVKVWTGEAGTARLGDGDNWEGGVAPAADDSLDFSLVTDAAEISADISGLSFGAVTMGSGVITFSGSLRAASFSDTSKVAVASGATVTVAGDLSFSGSGAEYVVNTVGENGRFVVEGDIIMAEGKGNSLNPFAAAECPGVIAAKGLVNRQTGVYNGGISFALTRSSATVTWEIGTPHGDSPLSLSVSIYPYPTLNDPK